MNSGILGTIDKGDRVVNSGILGTIDKGDRVVNYEVYRGLLRMHIILSRI